jgi:hypothetical protein
MVYSYSWVKLSEALQAQVATVEAQGDMVTNPGDRVRLILCADATPMWRTSATRCDAYLDIRQTPRILFFEIR